MGSRRYGVQRYGVQRSGGPALGGLLWGVGSAMGSITPTDRVETSDAVSTEAPSNLVTSLVR